MGKLEAQVPAATGDSVAPVAEEPPASVAHARAKQKPKFSAQRHKHVNCRQSSPLREVNVKIIKNTLSAHKHVKTVLAA